MPQLSGNSEKDITALYDYVVALRRELYDLLNNLDDDNVRQITARSIETSGLIVGENIQMGPNAVLSWEQVDGRPNTTFIGPDGIYTGELTAEQITAGTISADMIDTTNLYAERIKQPGYPNNYGDIGGSLGGLNLYESNSRYFAIYKGAAEAYLYAMGNSFLSSSDYGTYAYNDWDFTTANNVYLNGYAESGHTHGSYYIKNYTTSDSISISATEFGLIIRNGSTILGQIDYTVIGG